jgi:hypothetical protein
MFLENKYTSWYYSIVNTAKARGNRNKYTEKHHIIPESFFAASKRSKCPGSLLGNPGAANNIVRLLPREHFICHILLTKMTVGEFRKKMLFAVLGMKRVTKTQQRYMNSRLYSTVRTQASVFFSELNAGRKHSLETRAKVSAASKLRKHSDETKAKMSAASKGKPKSDSQINKMKLLKHSAESKAKMSAANKGRTASNATKAKQSAASLGKPKTKVHAENISKGLTGQSKPPMPEYLKKQISEKLKGRKSARKGTKGLVKHSPETKAKIAESNRRRVVSAETKAKIAASLAKTRALKKL